MPSIKSGMPAIDALFDKYIDGNMFAPTLLDEMINLAKEGKVDINYVHESASSVTKYTTNVTTALYVAIKHNLLEHVKELIKVGADVNFCPRGFSDVSRCEGTPLLVAVCKHRPDIVKTLLDAGADPNEDGNYANPDGHCATPLSVALWGVAHANETCEKEFTEITLMLLDAGANVHATDQHGRVPFAIALLTNKNIIAKMLDKGASQHDKDDHGHFAGGVALYLARDMTHYHNVLSNLAFVNSKMHEWA